MTDREITLRRAVLAVLASHTGDGLTVAELAAEAAAGERAGVVRAVVQRLAKEGRARNVSGNPQCTRWRGVSDAERLADAERIELRSRAKAAAEALRRLGVSTATADRGAVRVSVSPLDAERLAAVLSDLATCDGATS